MKVEFPGEMRQNFLVLKGRIESKVNAQAQQFPIKIVIPQGFPFRQPKVFLDMSISMQMLQSKPYLGH
jgi:UEV domain